MNYPRTSDKSLRSIVHLEKWIRFAPPASFQLPKAKTLGSYVDLTAADSAGCYRYREAPMSFCERMVGYSEAGFLRGEFQLPVSA
jgi:hypothetical protein